MRTTDHRTPRPALAALVVVLGLLAAACGASSETKAAIGENVDAPATAPEGDDGVAPAEVFDPGRPVAGADYSAADDQAPPAPSSGAGASAEGVTEESIRIGAHLPLTVSGVDISGLVPIEKMVEAYWNAVNAGGGIHGRTVEMVMVDDGYSPSTAITACRELASEEVFFVFGYTGSDQLTACGQHALELGIPYLSTGTSEAGLLGRPGYWALTLTQVQQAALAAEYIAGPLQGTGKKVALLRLNSPNADGIAAAFTGSAEASGLDVVVSDAVDKNPNPAQLQAECVKLQQAGAEFVYIYASGLVMNAAVQACDQQGYHPQWMGPSNGGACALTPPFGGEHMDGCLAFSTNRRHEAVESTFETQACDDWKASFPSDPCPPPTDLADLPGLWALLDVFRATLESVGPDLTRASFNQAMLDFEYDNGYLNPVDFAGTQVGGIGVVVLRADAGAGVPVEIESDWPSSFSS